MSDINPQATISLAPPSCQIPPFRSVENPQGDFTADRAIFWNYGDMLKNGTNVYGLVLANMPLEKALPTDEGQMCRLELIANATENLNDPLPAGTYNYVNLDTDYPEAGTFIGADSYFLDVFFDPEDPGSKVLKCYNWTITAGTITIEKVAEPEGDDSYPSYNVTCQMHGEIVDGETGEIFDERDLSVTYTGVIIYDDPNAYTPLGEDVELDLSRLSGRYTRGGNWTLSFFDVELDEDGFIIGAGNLFNMELFTDDPGYMDCDLLVGTFTPCDLFAGYEAGNYGQGAWYNLYGIYMSIGTYLEIYNDNADVERVGLAQEGKITCTKISDDIYHFDLNLKTPEGDKITGSWEGCIKDHVTDFVGVDEIEAGNITVAGHNGYIEAPEGARVFNSAGIETGLTDLAPGIYIVRLADRAIKVVVK